MTSYGETATRGRGFGALALLAAALFGAAVASVVLLHAGRVEHGAPSTAGRAAPHYECPMHPTVVRDEPGTCPICGMDLVEAGGGAAPATAAATPAPAGVDVRPRYQCPMHPAIVQDHPGECPICGMKLVPTGAGEAAAGGDGATGAVSPPGLATVRIDPARQQLIGLETAPVTRGTVGGAWRTVGRVAVDETRVRHINVKVPGFVEGIYVDFVGKPVKAGEPLFSIYSPELLSAQGEYLLALRTHAALRGADGTAGGGAPLVEAARRRLLLWDVPPAQIARLEKTGTPAKTLTLYSPISGVVTKKDVVEGMKLDAGAMPYEIVDLSEVWVLADVYENELRHVRLGMPARMSLKAYPNRLFEGRVSFIDPLLDPMTRTVKVRLAFPNPTGELKPEMFGEVTLLGASREGLRIPSDAVIDSGTRTVVFVAAGEGKFEPREVALGESDGAAVEVVSGVAEGERVVTRANFLVDSESRLRASLASIAEAPGATPPPAAGGAAAGHAGHAP